MLIEICNETNTRLLKLRSGEWQTYDEIIQRLLGFWDEPVWNP